VATLSGIGATANTFTSLEPLSRLTQFTALGLSSGSARHLRHSACPVAAGGGPAVAERIRYSPAAHA
jgi:hypothetical protein